jgi:hypothetical protein
VEKSSGKDAGKDVGGGAAVEHINFAAKDCDMHFILFLVKERKFWEMEMKAEID